MEKHLKPIATVGSATFLSRCLGLARDMLLFSLLGVSSFSSAFLLAFTIPNLFRRLLGEGALSSAFIPLFSEALEKEGKGPAFHFLNYTLSVLVCVLLSLCVLGGLVVLVLKSLGMKDYTYLECQLSITLLPYVFIVCGAAIVGAGLNVLHHFLLPALSAVWLNLAMISALGGCFLMGVKDPLVLVWALVGGVFMGGIFQIALPSWLLTRQGWQPRFSLRKGPRERELFALFLPAVLGASIFQINNAVSNFLAFAVDTKGVSLLYLSNRLLELPLGLFAVTVHTVLFPTLARDIAREDFLATKATFRQGVRLLWAITGPAALGLGALAEPIVGFLFQWGKFSALDVNLAAGMVRIFSCTIPFYALAAFSTRGFHALKDTKTPVCLAGFAFGLNVCLALLFIQPFGVMGLGYSSLAFSIFQAMSLQFYLSKKHKAFRIQGLQGFFLKVLFASLAMGLFAYGASCSLKSMIGQTKLAQFCVLLGIIPASVGIYLLCLYVLSVEEYHSILGLIRKRFRTIKKTE